MNIIITQVLKPSEYREREFGVNSEVEEFLPLGFFNLPGLIHQDHLRDGKSMAASAQC